MKRKLIYGVIVILFLCVIASLARPKPAEDITPIATSAIPTDTSQPTTTHIPLPTNTPQPTNTPAPPAPTNTPDPHVLVETLIRETLGTGNRDVARVASVELAADNWVTVNWAINDQFTEGLIKTSAKMDIAKVAETLCKAGFCRGLTMHGSFSMIDVYGNTSEDVVVKVVLRPETLTKINWDGFDYHKIYTIADAVNLHPTFAE